MVKIIYFDIDGTLRNETCKITENVRKVLKKCRKKGIYIVICTGRNLGSIQEDVKELETDGFISGGGCYIWTKGRMLQSKYFSMKVIEEMMKLIQQKDLGASLESKKEIYMNQKAAEFYQKDFENKMKGCLQAEQVKKANKIQYRDNFRKLQDTREKIHKICLIGEKKYIFAAEDQWKGKIQIVQKRNWNRQWYLEILPKDCGKGQAIRKMNQELGILKENSMSFGDGDNDIEMFLETGIRVAVEGASKELLKYADSVCEPPSDDGIPKELRRRGIIKVKEEYSKCKERSV